MKNYDVFISYRRSGGAETAKHLRDVLTHKGYRVFFDTDSLRSGDFDKQLLDVIMNCKEKMERYVTRMEEYLDMTDAIQTQSDRFYAIWHEILKHLGAGETQKAMNRAEALAFAAEGDTDFETIAQNVKLWIARGDAYSTKGCVMIIKYAGTIADYPLRAGDVILAVDDAPVNTSAQTTEAFAKEQCTLRLLRPDATGAYEEITYTGAVEDAGNLYAISLAY